MNGRDRWITLYVLCAGVLMVVLDVTVVNVALPMIQDDLGFSQSGLAWIVNSYLIGLGGVLLLAGRLGDIIGRKRMFLAGLVVFTVASLVCGLAQNQAVLVAGRFVQGVGGGMSSAVVLGMIAMLFPGPRERARAIGVYMFVATAGGAMGLLAGGAITEWIDWHWIFFINVPIGVLTALGAAFLVAADEGIGFGGGADVPGAVLITASLMLGVYTIVEPAATAGWGARTTVVLGGLSLALLVAFVAREATTRAPLVPLGIFLSRNVAAGNAIEALCMASLYGMFFLGALYMQRVLGYGPIEIGLAFLPKTVTMGLVSVRCAEPLTRRFGERAVLIVGLGLILVAFVLFARVPVSADYVTHLLPAMLLVGIGGGIGFPGLVTLAMSTATQRDAGVVSGLLNTTAEIGAAVGVAVVATLSATHTETLLKTGSATAAALTGGYRLGFAVGAALLVAAIAIAVTALERPVTLRAAPAPAQPAYSETDV